MARHRHHIERRLFDAVLLALASCTPTPAPVTPVGPTGPTRFAEPPPDAAVTTDAAVAPVVVGAQPDIHALCAGRAAATIDKSKATPAPPANEYGAMGENVPAAPPQSWDAQRGIVRCVITRETDNSGVSMLVTPTCCPTGRDPNTPCPSEYAMKVRGTQVLIETAELDARGALISSDLRWRITSAEAPRRHNCGRRPDGLAFEHTSECVSATAAHLVEMAELEAASVPAFERLARELAHHGAPADLVRRARAAMRDEVRHAASMRALAIAHGGVPREVRVASLPVRDLAAIARENAIEGCVREAYGALVATYQANAAPRDLRATFDAIARDERRHAALSTDVDVWLRSQLTAADLGAVELARVAAQAELRATLADAPSVPALGIPGGTEAVALFDAYFAG